MKHISTKPNVDEWQLEAVAKFQNILGNTVLEAVNEALNYILQDEGSAYVFFPVEWDQGGGRGGDGVGGKPVEDPLTLYLRIGLANNDSDEFPTYALNMREILTESMKACINDGSYCYGLKRLSTSLRELADELEEATKKGGEIEKRSEKIES